MNASEIGGRIKRARRAAGILPTVLASKSGVYLNTVYRYERGELTPSAPVVARIARALGVSADWLLTGEPANDTVSGRD